MGSGVEGRDIGGYVRGEKEREGKVGRGLIV